MTVCCVLCCGKMIHVCLCACVVILLLESGQKIIVLYTVEIYISYRLPLFNCRKLVKCYYVSTVQLKCNVAITRVCRVRVDDVSSPLTFI